MEKQTKHADNCGGTTGPVAYASSIDGNRVKTIFRLAKCACGFKTEWRVESTEQLPEEGEP